MEKLIRFGVFQSRKAVLTLYASLYVGMTPISASRMRTSAEIPASWKKLSPFEATTSHNPRRILARLSIIALSIQTTSNLGEGLLNLRLALHQAAGE
jgi:hypothetical protein